MSVRYLSVAIAATAALLMGATTATAAPAPTIITQADAPSVGKTTIKVDWSAAETLTYLGIRTDLLCATSETIDGRVHQSFDVIGDPTDGTVEHKGAIVFSTAKGVDVLWSLVVDTTRSAVTAHSNLSRPIDLFTLGANGSAGRTLVLTAAGADALNRNLGLRQDLFSEGFVYGYLKTTLNA